MRLVFRLVSTPCKIFIRNVVTRPRLFTADPTVPILQHKMAQRSITSFFTKTPKKSLDKSNDGSTEKSDLNSVKHERTESESEPICSPTEHSSTSDANKPKQSKKRMRIQSSDSEASSHASRSPSPVDTIKKKTPKRQRIESSDSEPASPKKVAEKTPPKPKTKASSKEVPEKAPPEPKAKASPKEVPEKAPPEPKAQASPKEVLEKSPPKPKIKASPKEKTPKAKKSEKLDKSPLVEKDTNVNVASVNIVKTENNETENGKEIMEKVTESTYNPGKSKYHPIEDACWSRGERVPYLALARTLEAIEATSARLRIVETLANYLRSVLLLTPEDLLPSVYLCLNRLAPAYESLELGVAETYLMKAIAQSTGRTLAQVKTDVGKVGDLGLVAEQSRSTQRVMFRPAPLVLRNVFLALKELANMTGQSSMSKKVAKIQSLFVACRESEARYLIRSMAGKLRIGLAEQSVLQALALATLLTPPGQPWPPEVLDASRGVAADVFKARLEAQALIIKTTYCECPNYELLIPVLLERGVEELPSHCRLTPGVPLKPMLAHPTKGVHEVFQRFENLQFTCEWKYDGERAQIHVPEREGARDLARAAVFSRNQEDNSGKYPDVLARLGGALRDTVASCVLDCEAVAWDRENKRILPFQVLSTRKRKDAQVSEIKVQVCLFMFDLLYLNGRALVREPLAERRRLLHEHFNVVEGEWMMATSRDCSTLEEVQEFLEESVRGSCEGLMVKTLAGRDATYEIAKRSRNWLKLKKDYLDGVGDTLDVVVIGAYRGRGKRAGVYGGFLLACYDADGEEFQSLCKIGTGFTDDDLQRHSESLEQYRIDAPRNYYRYDTSHEPDVWLAPGAVWEVRCADLSLSPAHRAAIGLVDPDKGISLRFPRFVRVREDKTPEQATSARQVAAIYLDQDQVKNQAAAPRLDDDFY